MDIVIEMKFPGMWLEKNFLKLIAKLKKASLFWYAQIKLASINSGTVFRLFWDKRPL